MYNYLNFLIVKSKIEKGKVVLKKDYLSVVLDKNVGDNGNILCRIPDIEDTIVNKSSKNEYDIANKTLYGDVKDYFLQNFLIDEFCYGGSSKFKYFYPKVEKDVENKFYLTIVNHLYKNLNDTFSTQLFLNKDKWSLTDSSFLELTESFKNKIILINLYAVNIKDELKPFDYWDDYLSLKKIYKNKIVCLNICYAMKNYVNVWEAIIKQNETNDNYYFYPKEIENKTFTTYFKHLVLDFSNPSYYLILDKNGKLFYKNIGPRYSKAYKKIDELLNL